MDQLRRCGSVGDMNSPREQRCNVCQLRRVYNTAVVWCSECEEALCSECKQYHGLMKMSRNHKTVYISDYQRLAPSVLAIKNRCDDHEEKFEYFCDRHGKPCCIICIKDRHKECRDLKQISDLIKDSKSSNECITIERGLKNVLQTIDRVRKDRTDNILTLDDQATRYQNELREMKRAINDHLDRMESQFLDEMATKQREMKSRIQRVIDDIDERREKVQKKIRNINAMKRYASDLQNFLGIRGMEFDVKNEQEYLKALKENGSLDSLDMFVHFHSFSALEAIKNNVTVLGRITTKTTRCTLKVTPQNSNLDRFKSISWWDLNDN
ncbi:E3 ubiquitin/ISG15 ligase TRIM25-like isoform X1 [Mytilus trossulus]|uniref:E3 ubiquitin/ISG15 ligase TRIM25-like isoform X1 n=2 Tax=Mytilus trossulus TaxID=6551 RepID=UPI0030073259